MKCVLVNFGQESVQKYNLPVLIETAHCKYIHMFLNIHTLKIFKSTVFYSEQTVFTKVKR